VVQSFNDEPLTVCPACGGALRKVFGSIGIAFKGSGFYKNDSRTGTNGVKKEAKKDKESPTSTESSKKESSGAKESSSSGSASSDSSSSSAKAAASTSA
jgi:predicted nucleic acid-binding Zn ribbon protein